MFTVNIQGSLEQWDKSLGKKRTMTNRNVTSIISIINWWNKKKILWVNFICWCCTDQNQRLKIQKHTYLSVWLDLCNKSYICEQLQQLEVILISIFQGFWCTYYNNSNFYRRSCTHLSVCIGHNYGLAINVRVLIKIQHGPTTILQDSSSCEQKYIFQYFKRDGNYKCILN